MKKQVLLAMAILALVMTGLTIQSGIGQVRASTTTIISQSDVAAYSDSAGTVPLGNINWGTVIIDSPKTQNFYLKNNGNSAYMTMTPTLSNFVFRDKNGNVITTNYSQYFTVTLDRVGAIISSNDCISAELTLIIAYGIDPTVASFSLTVTLNFKPLVSPADLNGDGQVNMGDLDYFVYGLVQYQK